MYGANLASASTLSNSPTMEALYKHLQERNGKTETSRLWEEIYQIQNNQAASLQFLVSEIDKLKAAIEPVKAEDVKQAA